MQVRWTESALAQLDELLVQLASRRSQAVRRRLAEHLLERVGSLGELPWAAPPWRPAGDPSFRQLGVDEHMVIYRVLEAESSVVVLAVRHGRQRPPEPDELPTT
jgi:plasmid stabilization system protein ParE